MTYIFIYDLYLHLWPISSSMIYVFIYDLYSYSSFIGNKFNTVMRWYIDGCLPEESTCGNILLQSKRFESNRQCSVPAGCWACKWSNFTTINLWFHQKIFTVRIFKRFIGRLSLLFLLTTASIDFQALRIFFIREIFGADAQWMVQTRSEWHRRIVNGVRYIKWYMTGVSPVTGTSSAVHGLRRSVLSEWKWLSPW